MSTELQECKRKVKQLKSEMEDFVYIVSHDLKAPLRAIATLSSFIEEDLGPGIPEGVKDNLDLMKNRVHRLQRMMEALLQYSRVSRIDMEIETVDLQKMIEEILSMIAPPAGLKIEVGKGMPVFQTYREKIYTVLYNIIENAIKFNTKEDGKVEIGAKELEEFYEFTIKDNGMGITSDSMEKIFTIFYTIQPKDKSENTGAGLAITRKIIEFMNGNIAIESNGKDGSVFRFTWPKVIADKSPR